ncbi:unnamed protein product (macronuclear) [Paramecium tetraurelia]|uniref:Uncharacterized protein n=1 Tax=Paramecium tetraurelia TaxID=5888 RepID=A0DGZ5_PARTE|nr:uncharacterized protein GSPATT00002441001 [Paramecium tetraurelia]CAK82312.1 unnamed protein product [Paramecium tetraurelia]
MTYNQDAIKKKTAQDDLHSNIRIQNNYYLKSNKNM